MNNTLECFHMRVRRSDDDTIMPDRLRMRITNLTQPILT
jgi:hypothetical protein